MWHKNCYKVCATYTTIFGILSTSLCTFTIVMCCMTCNIYLCSECTHHWGFSLSYGEGGHFDEPNTIHQITFCHQVVMITVKLSLWNKRHSCTVHSCITLGNNTHIRQFCEVTVWLLTFAVSRSQFYCGQNFQPRQFCWHVNKTAYLSSYTEAFRSSGRKTDQNCLPWKLHGRFSVQREFC